jgi:hypothetical protein
MGFNTEQLAAVTNGAQNATFGTLEMAGENIAAGDCIGLGDDGKGYWLMPPEQVGSSLRPLLSRAAISNGLQSPVVNFAKGGATQGRIAGAALTNGNYVFAYCLAAAPYNVYFGVIDAYGQTQVPLTLVGPALAGGSGQPLVTLTALVGGGFVVGYNNGGTATIAVFGNNGVLIKAPTAVGATGGSLFALQIASLTSGAFAVCFASGAAGSTNEAPWYAVLSATGAIVQAATRLRAQPTANPSAQAIICGVAALVGGGFVCAYTITPATVVTTYFQRFDNVGVQQGAETVVRSGATAGSGVLVRGLSSGGFVVVETADVNVTVYNSAGVLVGAQQARDPGVKSNKLSVSSASQTNVGLIAWSSTPSTTIKLSPIYDTGPITGVVTVSTTAAPDGDIQSSCAYLASGINAVMYADSGLSARLATYDGYFTLKASTIIPGLPSDLGGAAPPAGVLSLLTPPIKPNEVSFFLCLPTASGAMNFSFVNAYIQKYTFVGVASATVLAGQPVPYQSTGWAATRLPFAPRNVDGSRASQPGQRANFAGGFGVTLFGSSPAPTLIKTSVYLGSITTGGSLTFTAVADTKVTVALSLLPSAIATAGTTGTVTVGGVALTSVSATQLAATVTLDVGAGQTVLFGAVGYASVTFTSQDQ